MKETTLRYLSHEDMVQIRALLWEADNDEEPSTSSGTAQERGSKRRVSAPQAIIQIVHGASEHIERYRDFAAFLVRAGYVVCGADHVGHGKSASTPEQLGHMPLKKGRDILLEDVHTLRQRVQSVYPDVPYVLFGHSMGSFILREYLVRCGNGLAAAIISGTAQQSPLLSFFGGLVAKFIAALHGAEQRSTFLHNLGLGAYGKQIPNARTTLDWLSTDPTVVDAYSADNACGMQFSAGAYVTLTELTGRIVTSSHADQIPKTVPLLFIAGAQDPVGENGKGVRKAVRQYQQAGVEHITLNIYDGMRHEVLNEVEREQVYKDIVAWLQEIPSLNHR